MKHDRLKDIRLIAVDLDGTLLPKDKKVSPRTLRALEACRARGIMLAFATGRSESLARPYLEQLKPDAAVLCYGAQIICRGETVFRRCMSPKVATAVLHGAATATKLRYQLADGRCYLSEPSEGTLPLERDAVITARTEHLCAWDLPAATAKAVAKEAGCAITQLIGDRWCNFGARGTGKGPGMRQAMRLMGIQRGQAVAFGDESCDIDFFRECGFGVAMDNADDETLAHADARTESNDCDGVAVFLERYILA